jgi:putative peptidoglycan lipid II flippase
MKDSTQSIFRSAQQFLTGTMCSRMTGLLRDVVMAFAFGTDSAVAAFLVAFRFSHLLRRLFGEGALQTAFTPQYEKLKQIHPERAGFFFRDLSFLLSLSLSFLIFISMLFLGSYLVLGSSSKDNQQIIQLTLLMMPSLLFICLFGLNASLLQCEKSYFIPGIAPVAFNVVWIVGICCLWNFSPFDAMPFLALFLILACFAQWVTTVPKTLKILQTLGLKNLFEKFHFFSTDLRNLIKPLLLGMIGVGAAQINNALDAIFARYASTQGPAYLWYAIRVQQLPLALIGIAISGALLPPLSRAIKSSNWIQSVSFLNFAMQRCIVCMIPITLGIFALGNFCITLLYERGGFDQISVLSTTQCLWGYGFGLMPMALVLILAPAFYAQDNYRFPMLISLFTMLLNIVLNYAVVVILKYNTASIAWTTSCCSWVNFLILAYALRKTLGPFALGLIWPCSSKVFLSSLGGCLCVILFEMAFHSGSIQIDEPNFMKNLIRFSINSMIFCVGTGVVGWSIGALSLFRIWNQDVGVVLKEQTVIKP